MKKASRASGDTPPAECHNVVMYETSPTGMVLRKIDPTPTAEQLQAKEEEAERAKALIKTRRSRSARTRRCSTPSAPSASSTSCATARSSRSRGASKSAQDRIKAVEKRQAEIQEEWSSTRRARARRARWRLPPSSPADLERFTKEQATLKNNIVNYENEIEQLA